MQGIAARPRGATPPTAWMRRRGGNAETALAAGDGDFDDFEDDDFDDEFDDDFEEEWEDDELMDPHEDMDEDGDDEDLARDDDDFDE